MPQHTRVDLVRCTLAALLLASSIGLGLAARAQDAPLPTPPPPAALEAERDSVSADSAATMLMDLLQRLRDEQAEDDDSLRMTGDGWVVAVSEEFGYQIEFPEAPITQSTAPNVEMKLYEPDPTDGYVALAARIDPDAAETFTQAQMMDNAVQGMMASLEGTIVRDEKTIVQGYPARVVVVDAANGERFGYQYVIAEDILYAVGKSVAAGDVDTFETGRFFQGFRIDASLTYPRLARLMDEAGIVYDRDENGFNVVFELDDDRVQGVYVSNEEFIANGTTITALFGMIYRGPKPPSAEIAQRLLLENGRFDTGSFRVYSNEDGTYTLAFVTYLPLDAEASVLDELLLFTAQRADAIERVLLNQDKW
ncbi:MAG: hypothetical protein AAF809_06030 [Bacteroidota bacterium]